MFPEALASARFLFALQVCGGMIDNRVHSTVVTLDDSSIV